MTGFFKPFKYSNYGHCHCKEYTNVTMALQLCAVWPERSSFASLVLPSWLAPPSDDVPLHRMKVSGLQHLAEVLLLIPIAPPSWVTFREKMAAIKSKNRKCQMPWQGDKYIDIKKVVKSSDVDRIVTTIEIPTIVLSLLLMLTMRL
jgi:hypothetical protein